MLERVASGALATPGVGWGMEVSDVRSQATPDFGSRRAFRADSPILVKRSNPERSDTDHLTFDDAGAILTATLRRKLEAAGLGEHASGASMRFDRSYRGAKTKLVTIGPIANRANFCPVIVDGAPQAVQFAWNTGAGHSTGVGFGGWCNARSLRFEKSARFFGMWRSNLSSPCAVI